MGDTIRASERGLQLIDIARRRKGWTKYSSPIWWDTAHTSKATLSRFLAGHRIERETFIEICAAVGIPNWQDIVDLSPEPIDPDLERDYRRATGESGTPTKTVSIGYSDRHPSQNIARQFYRAFRDAGYHPFLIGDDRQRGFTWTQTLDSALQQSDYLLLLLDREGAKSEMVTEVVQRAKESDRPPEILPICVDLPEIGFLNPDLQGHLQPIKPLDWSFSGDNRNVVREVFDSIAQSRSWRRSENDIAPIIDAGSTHSTPPLPTAAPELELPNGQVELVSQFYIPRPPMETRAMEFVTQPGALIRIKAPRQMGKTSLMARLLAHAERCGHRKVSLSFQLADASVFTDLDRFLQWFCASIGRRLKLENRLSEYWDEIFGSKDNCTAYFEEYVLPELDAPLVLGLDEVDRVFQYPAIAGDFFGLLRAWHEDAKNREIWRKLHLVVVHSTEVYVPMDLNQSPFNVGLPVELPEFSSQQVEELAKRHGLNWQTSQVTRLMEMVGGHPYLVRLALYHVAKGDLSLDEFWKTAPSLSGLYGDHLRRHWWNLQQYPDLLEAIKRVARSPEPIRVEAILSFKLYSMGLVSVGSNTVTISCQLYRQYFRNCFGID
ncbi:MAG TPA: AAA-like domain-containing protein [Oscillatoriales cyanobacterium M59_W2019_021]|nr:AAA-like domain-containing protein [Oscillatoriales cyanobacterium M4454_W2019_049]HIK51947.1 AAA-like domain-containing protein [Oscillatoriales cyanobacterium M59_W2019_021]